MAIERMQSSHHTRPALRRHWTHVPGTVRRFTTFVVAILAASGAACDGRVIDPAGERTAVAIFELELFPTAQQQQGGRSVSVMEKVILGATAAGRRTTREASLGATDREIAIEVSVPIGQVVFDALVESNNGTDLYTGAANADVQADGFQVAIDLVAKAPVLVATPDSLRVRSPVAAPFPTPFTLTNRGLGVVEWSVVNVQPPLNSCGLYPCLRLNPVSGTVAVGESGRLSVQALNTSERLYRIRVGSPEGTVELIAHADSTAPSGVIEAVIRNEGGGPVPAWGVTLLACSVGSRTGSPGLCVPDESIAPQTRSADNSGVARFAGLPDGFWLVRPAAPQAGVMRPTQTTLSLSPGGLARPTFTAPIIP